MKNALGRGDNTFERDSDGGDFDEAYEVGEELVVARCDTPELFELIEKSFEDAWRYDRLGTGIWDGVHQSVGVVGSISEHGAGLYAVDQSVRSGHVVFLARAGQKAAGMA